MKRRITLRRVAVVAAFLLAVAAFSWLMLSAALDELFCDVSRDVDACLLEPEP